LGTKVFGALVTSAQLSPDGKLANVTLDGWVRCLVMPPANQSPIFPLRGQFVNAEVEQLMSKRQSTFLVLRSFVVVPNDYDIALTAGVSPPKK